MRMSVSIGRFYPRSLTADPRNRIIFETISTIRGKAMTRTSILAILALAVAPACSDSGGGGGSDSDTDTDTDSDTGTDTGTDTSTDTSTDTGTDTSTDTSTDTGTDTSTDTGTDTTTDTGTDTSTDTAGACGNTGDLAIIGATDVGAALYACTLGCASDADPEGCTAACVATDTGLSAGCSACYGALGTCTVASCLTDCAGDPTSSACVDCTTASCGDAFTACSGVPIDEAGLWGGTDTDTGSDTDTGAVDACNNTDDLAIIGTTDMATALNGCIVGCTSDPDPAGCTGDCVATDTGVSTACGSCYGDIGVCIVANCLTDCLADPTSVACIDCTDTNCGAAYEVCSGVAFADSGLY
jgi:hypothetical protein